MMDLIGKTRSHDLFKMGKDKLLKKFGYIYGKWRFRNAPSYTNPTQAELQIIETDLRRSGITIEDYSPSPDAFNDFKKLHYFSNMCYGGEGSDIFDEKLLEHWISYDRLGLKTFDKNDIYVDVAACTSPWAQILREHMGVNAYAIDLSEVGLKYSQLPYYRIEDATHTSFSESSVRGASLQCAYEMFMGDSDTRLIWELARILTPVGKVIIIPLYLHTHYCAYATPEYFGKGYADPEAKEYIQ